jgi:heat shock protein HslJ
LIIFGHAADNEPESDDNRDNTSEHLLTERISKSEEPGIDTTESMKSNDLSNNSSLSGFPDINNIYSQYLLQQQQLALASTAPPSIRRPL